MSDTDIDKGRRWELELPNQLSENRFGILCLTPENLESRWVLFEAGAMSRDFDARVSAYLFGLSNAAIKPPLTQFQNTIVDKDDTKKLVLSINHAIGSPLDDAQLAESFEVWWPKLEDKLGKIPPAAAPPPKRGSDEILGEILEHVREIRRGSTADLAAPRPQLSGTGPTDPYSPPPFDESLPGAPRLAGRLGAGSRFRWGTSLEQVLNRAAVVGSPLSAEKEPKKK